MISYDEYERYEKYLKSPEWAAKRDARLKIDRFQCRMCGKPAEQVHHLTYHRLFRENVWRDLVSVCDRCHASIHTMMNRPTGIRPDGSVRYGWSDDLPAGIRRTFAERNLA